MSFNILACSSGVIGSQDKTYENQKSALGQLELVMKGLDVKIKLLNSKKLELFCKNSSDTLKADVSRVEHALYTSMMQ